jgi:hypothetical protein
MRRIPTAILWSVPAGWTKLLSLMFTYDPAFDPKGPRACEVQQWCEANNIRRDQIYYEKSARKYCKESRAQVIEFERRNRRPCGTVSARSRGGGRSDRTLPICTKTSTPSGWRKMTRRSLCMKETSRKGVWTGITGSKFGPANIFARHSNDACNLFYKPISSCSGSWLTK